MSFMADLESSQESSSSRPTNSEDSDDPCLPLKKPRVTRSVTQRQSVYYVTQKKSFLTTMALLTSRNIFQLNTLRNISSKTRSKQLYMTITSVLTVPLQDPRK